VKSVPRAGIEPAASTFRAWRHYQQQLPRNPPKTVFSKTLGQFHGFYESHGLGYFAAEVTGFGDWFGDFIHPLCWRSANKKSPAF
jgi:hypothetical protein